MARYKPGQSGNPAGKKKGTPNLKTEQLRGMVQAFIEKNFDGIQAEYDKIKKPSEKLNFVVSLLKYILPPPVSLEALSETQLQQLEQYFLKKYVDGQRGINPEH